MKFAEHIAESSIPEWRDKYIDYKLGKKKIKTCRKYLEVSNKEIFDNNKKLKRQKDNNAYNHASSINAYDFPNVEGVQESEEEEEEEEEEEDNDNISPTQSPMETESTPLISSSNNYTPEQMKCIREFVDDWVIKDQLKNSEDFYIWQINTQALTKFDDLALQMKIYTKRKENGLYLRESFSDPLSRTNTMSRTNSISSYATTINSSKKKKRLLINKQKNSSKNHRVGKKHSLMARLKYKLYEYDLMPSLPTFDEFPRLKKLFHGTSSSSSQSTFKNFNNNFVNPFDSDTEDLENVLRDEHPHNVHVTNTHGHHHHAPHAHSHNRSVSFIWKRQETFVISDDQACRQLSQAIIEFYLYLELLKSFRDINLDGFRKILKKFDKMCLTNEMNNFLENKLKKTKLYKDSINWNNEDLICKWEAKLTQWYLDDLSNSSEDRKERSRFLSSSTIKANMDELSVHKSNICSKHCFLSGLNIAFSMCIITTAMYYGAHSTNTSQLHKMLLPIWGGWYLVTLMGLLFQLNCFLWFKNKVNYRFIIFNEIIPTSKFGTSLFHNDFASTRIPSHLYYSSTILMVCCVLSFFSLYVTKTLEPWTTSFVVFLLLVLLKPQTFLPHMENFARSSFWNLITLVRLICSGIYPVKFSDFFLGDMICSLIYSLSDIALYFCLINPSNKCGSSNSYTMGVLTALPSYFRMIQCLRRYFDSGDWFPHLINAVKYFFTILYYLSLMLFRINPKNVGFDIRFWFILISTINSVCSALWDITLDWSLFQSLEWSTFLLRKDLYMAGEKDWKTGRYPKRGRLGYYLAIILDIIVRFQWLAYIFFPANIQQNAMTSLGIAFAELFRRWVWMIFRIENEHVVNVHIFKISGETQLPYNVGENIYSLYAQDHPTTDLESISSSNSNVSYPEEIVQFSPSVDNPHLIQHKPMRRSSTLEMVTKAIPWAHAQDFQRGQSFSSVSIDEEIEEMQEENEEEQRSMEELENSDSDEY